MFGSGLSRFAGKGFQERGCWELGMVPIESITEKFANGQLHNLVLSVLPEADLASLLRSAREIYLGAGTVLFAERDEINDVYFPETGLISLCIEAQDGRWAETAT